MTSSSRDSYADHQRMSADVNNKVSFNNNPSSSPAVDCLTRDQAAAAASVSHRRSDFADYRPASGGAAGASSTFWSPKLECRGAGSGRTSAKKTQRTSTSTSGRWRQKMSVSGGGKSQASDSVRAIQSTTNQHHIYCNDDTLITSRLCSAVHAGCRLSVNIIHCVCPVNVLHSLCVVHSVVKLVQLSRPTVVFYNLCPRFLGLSDLCICHTVSLTLS